MNAGTIRRKCLRDGHKFKRVAGVALPFVFCSRWFCDASLGEPWAGPGVVGFAENRNATLKVWPTDKEEK